MAHTKNYRRACDSLFSVPYSMQYWDTFDYSRLQYINTVTRVSKKHNYNQLFNDCFIMADTETSKKATGIQGPNHVCAWSLAIRAYHKNVVCLWGTRPDELPRCINLIHQSMPGDHTIIYFHNYAYDYCFERRFLFEELGTPKKQLATKPYYPIFMNFKNGIQIRDSLILAQCKLEKWAKDLGVEHQKAVGSWDYDKLRNQNDNNFSPDELLYMQNDVLAGVECLDTLCIQLKKHVYTMPYTATGVPRDEIRKIGKKYHAHQLFTKCSNSWDDQMLLELVYHGGYTHAFRDICGWIQPGAICYDFTSSYPYSMLMSMVPMDKFREYDGAVTVQRIIEHADRYAFMFILTVTDFELKDPHYPMPMLQKSKLIDSDLCIEDNGRITKGKLAIIAFNEYDLMLFTEMYKVKGALRITDVKYAPKDYMPRWFTDYVFQLFKDKSELKHVDKVRYAIAKAKLNSCYGLCVQKPVRKEIQEDYDTGEYNLVKNVNPEEKYQKYLDNYNNVLPYSWGVWVTSESMFRLYQLSKCIDYENGGVWLYSDTDSIYASKWNMDRLNAFNDEIRRKCTERGYAPFYIKDEEFCLGLAVCNPDDGDISEEFITLGAKRYAKRDKFTHELKITISGVPKKGVVSLNNDLNEFKPGKVFKGTDSGKLQHTYFFLDPDQEPYEDAKGNLTADSIDLSPCDYTLDSPYSDDAAENDKDMEEYYLPEMEDFD